MKQFEQEGLTNEGVKATTEDIKNCCGSAFRYLISDYYWKIKPARDKNGLLAQKFLFYLKENLNPDRPSGEQIENISFHWRAAKTGAANHRSIPYVVMAYYDFIYGVDRKV